MRAPRVALSRELPQDRKVARVSGLWRVREGFLLPFCDLCRRRPGQPARARPPRHPALHVAARPPRTRLCQRCAIRLPCTPTPPPGPARPGRLGVDRGGRITLGGSAAALLRRACVLGISKAFRVQL